MHETYRYFLFWQNQYIFIHDAVLEALMCGDTQIPITDLCQAIERLKQKDEQNEGKTGLDLQFEVRTNNYHNLTTQLK